MDVKRSLTKARPLVVAISSRALFNLDESHQVFESEGLAAYASYQISKENDCLEPGVAFSLVRKLLALNHEGMKHQGVEVILVSRNSADSGLRIFNSIEKHGLDIERAVFRNGERPFRYMQAIGTDLFLSANAEDVRESLEAGFAAATVLPGAPGRHHDKQLRIAFDGDAVLFDDESEKLYRDRGLKEFADHEKAQADIPMQEGPFKPLVQALQKIQAAYPIENNPIRTALVTARSAPAHKRVILTLRSWGLRIDEALFLGGRSKGPFLAAFGADIFFDDQWFHCSDAAEHVAAGHVPNGVRNEQDEFD
jgi:5'-nucleotidase